MVAPEHPERRSHGGDPASDGLAHTCMYSTLSSHSGCTTSLARQLHENWLEVGTRNLSFELSNLSAFDGTCTLTHLSASGIGGDGSQDIKDVTFRNSRPLWSPLLTIATPQRGECHRGVERPATEASLTPSTATPSARQSARTEASPSPSVWSIGTFANGPTPRHEDVLDQLQRTMRDATPRPSGSSGERPAGSRRSSPCMADRTLSRRCSRPCESPLPRRAPVERSPSLQRRHSARRQSSGHDPMRSSQSLRGVGRAMMSSFPSS
mmetsp:Transcript_17724/g.41098  ORF Transcript_17724/g.41098 Transcript_17724/m.41098 type:complete len:266 (-) Transcript_17724:11-808(-)